MLKTTKTARKGRFSNFLATRTPQNFDFLRKHSAMMSTRKTEMGTIKCTVIVPTTGQGTFAYGRTFDRAYKNVIKNFNLKYN